MRYTIKQIIKSANQLLQDSGILEPPVNPRKVALQLGIDIIDRNFTDDISGALMFKNGSHFIICNINHSENRKKFTIAHELGHYFLKHSHDQEFGRDGLFIDKKEHFIFRNEHSATGEERQEVEANAFAAALLMPESMVREEMQKLSNVGFDFYDEDETGAPPIIKTLANKFQVSTTAMTFRVANLRLLNNF